MPIILAILITAILTGCTTYKGSEIWRRSVCEHLIDADERAQCLVDATRPENEYKQDVEQATGGS